MSAEVEVEVRPFASAEEELVALKARVREVIGRVKRAAKWNARGERLMDKHEAELSRAAASGVRLALTYLGQLEAHCD